MKEFSKHLIDHIETTRNVHVLYMCEAGSKAWGYGNVYSDHDIFFIYCHKDTKQYMNYHKQLETITLKDTNCNIKGYNNFIPKFDVFGWDVRKCANLGAQSNCNLLQYIRSPYVYKKEGVLDTLFSLMDEYIRPTKVYYNYYNDARNKISKTALHNDTDNFNIKKYIKAIDKLVRLMWFLEFEEFPPCDLVKLSEDFKDFEYGTTLIKKLIEKREMNETDFNDTTFNNKVRLFYTGLLADASILKYRFDALEKTYPITPKPKIIMNEYINVVAHMNGNKLI